MELITAPGFFKTLAGRSGTTRTPAIEIGQLDGKARSAEVGDCILSRSSAIRKLARKQPWETP
jgi:hypothetical protein